MKRVRHPLDGRTVLVVEDDFLVGQDLRSVLEAGGARALGPVDDIAKACAVARTEEIDGALLDVRMWDQTAAPVAVELAQRDIPFIVISGGDNQFALRADGALQDISPTVLGMLGISQPKEMTGHDLRVKKQ